MGKASEEAVKNRTQSTMEGLALKWRDPMLTQAGFQKGKWGR